MNRNALKKIGALALTGALALSVIAFAGCSSNKPADNAADGDKTITVAATPAPHADILNDAVAPVLAEQGYTLVVKEFTDYVLPNTATEEGEVDANYFQHTPYLDSFNEENGTHLVSIAGIHFEPLSIYAGRTTDLSALANGAIVAVPNDTTNEARALLLLEAQGLITLDPSAGMTATVNDITDNPLNLEIKELEAASVPTVLADVDIAVINGNYALGAGLTGADALASEAVDSLAADTYVNVVVVHEDNVDSDKSKALAAAFLDPSVSKYITDNYDGAVVPVF